MVDTCHYTFVQSRGTARVNINVNYGLWMIMRFQSRFLSCNKCTTLVGGGGVDNGGGYARVGAVDSWETSVPFFQFAANLKLL